jgi:small subunit ribosomal protein S11
MATDKKKKTTQKNKTVAKKPVTKKKKKLTFVNGVAHIHSTANNTIVSITDENGNVIS